MRRVILCWWRTLLFLFLPLRMAVGKERWVIPVQKHRNEEILHKESSRGSSAERRLFANPCTLAEWACFFMTNYKWCLAPFSFSALPVPCHSATTDHSWNIGLVSMLDMCFWPQAQLCGPADLQCPLQRRSVPDTFSTSSISWVRSCWAQDMKETPPGHLLFVVCDSSLLLRLLLAAVQS